MPATETFKKVKSATGGSIIRQRLIELVKEGKKDNEIAPIFGVTRQAVAKARSDLHLENNHFIDEVKLIILHGMGKTDSEISKELGVVKSTVTKARHKLLLPANKPQGRPSTREKVEITEEIIQYVLDKLERGQTPSQVARDKEITRTDVIEIVMANKQKSWLDDNQKLDLDQRDVFENWIIRVRDILSKKIRLANVDRLKRILSITRKSLDKIPVEQRGMLPTPEVMARLGVRNPFLVDLYWDSEYIVVKHKISILERAVDRALWEEIRTGMELMDEETLKIAEKFLREEVYPPIFGAEFNFFMAGSIKDTRNYADMPGLSLDSSDYEPCVEVAAVIQEENNNISTTGSAKRRGNSGGKRKNINLSKYYG